MPFVITKENVTDGFLTSAGDTDIDSFITVMNQADTCLTKNSVSDEIGRRLKILAVRHLLTLGSEGGSVVDQQSASGARRRFAERRSGTTPHLDALRMLDGTGCVTAVLQKSSSVQVRAVGRYSNGLK